MTKKDQREALFTALFRHYTLFSVSDKSHYFKSFSARAGSCVRLKDYSCLQLINNTYVLYIASLGDAVIVLFSQLINYLSVDIQYLSVLLLFTKIDFTKLLREQHFYFFSVSWSSLSFSPSVSILISIFLPGATFIIQQ